MPSIPTMLFPLIAAGALTSPILAQQIANRATLDAILGTQRVLEDFENYEVYPGQAVNTLVPAIDVNTILGTQGRGHVAFGATYGPPLSVGFQWNGPGYLGIATRSLFSIGALQITYATPVSAMGLDLVAFQGADHTGSVTIKDAAGATIGTIPFSMLQAAPNQRTFVGWQHAAGIGSVVIQNSPNHSMPSIDDHAFGLDTGQVASNVAYGTGCGDRFASFYQTYANFDLSNTSLVMIPTGSGYVVFHGNAAMHVPTSSPLTMSNRVACPLGWTLPFPGGSTTVLHVASAGFVQAVATNFLTYAFSRAEFLNNGPVWAAKWRALSHDLGGAVYFDTDPIAGTAYVTFDRIPDFGSAANVNTFQFAFDRTGTVEMRFGPCAATSGGTGWSPGLNSLDPGSIDLSATPVILTDAVDARALDLTSNGRPVLGSTIALTVGNIPSNSAIAALLYGLVRHDPGIGLSSLGMPGCFQWSSWDAAVSTLSPGTSMTRAFTIPNDVGLTGLHVFVQAAIHDPSLYYNAARALSSNAIDLFVNGR